MLKTHKKKIIICSLMLFFAFTVIYLLSSATVNVPDTGSFASQGSVGGEPASVMDYVLTGIMVLAGCAGTTLLIRFCLHSHNMKLDRRD